MEFEFIIKNALIEYDKNQPDIINFVNNIEYIKIIKTENKSDKFIFYNNKDEIILESNIEHMGIYFNYNNILKWAWADPTLNPNYTIHSREILNYALNLTNKHDLFLKTELINSSISIINNYQLDIYVAIICYILKKKLIIPLSYFKNEEINHNIYNDEIINFKKLQEYNIKSKDDIFRIDFIYILDFE